jgi:hypothetical protein
LNLRVLLSKDKQSRLGNLQKKLRTFKNEGALEKSIFPIPTKNLFTGNWLIRLS